MTDTTLDVRTLTGPIRAALGRSRHGLDFDNLQVTPILNWGGFVNRSFKISDGRSAFCLKLASNPERHGRLRHWHTLGTHLAQHYRAPRIHDWIELEGTPCAGILCEWIDGTAPEVLAAPLVDDLYPLLVDLHADRQLVRALTRTDRPSRTCKDTYLETYHDRFLEDLEFVTASRPPFAPPERLHWIQHEIALLEHRVRNTPAFEEPASAPVHGDFWLNNLLVDGSGRVFVLDWDEMRLGDPVLDWTMFLGPSRTDPRPATARPEVTTLQLTPAERTRLNVYARASLLDWILDPLADWVAARDEPEQFHAIQPANERVHKLAVANYAALYGTSAGSDD